eukprot:EC122800.1.p1 GENE.EC122800.1~~EC122800.1.p1  ORF type:complete len:110 (+),score=2.32 EC122800.1:130-459(+)
MADGANAELEDALTQASTPDSSSSISCVSALDALYYCYTPRNQITNYYRFGTVDPCSEALQTAMFCLSCKWKWIKDPVLAKELWQEHKVKTRKFDKHVWELKGNTDQAS